MMLDKHLPLLLPTIFLLLATGAWAQSVRIGAVLSATGNAAAIGQAQLRVLDALAVRLQANGGIYGQKVEILIRDDASIPGRTLELARQLVEDKEVHALICCSIAAAARLVTPLVDRAGVPALSLAPIPGEPPHPLWFFSLAPSTKVLMKALVDEAARRGATSVGLMTFDNAFGDEAARLLAAASSEQGIVLAGEARYRPDASVLTPEALWVASRQPDAVVVWGLTRDVRLAVDGLRKRGFTGSIYTTPDILSPLAGGIDPTTFEGVSVPVTPVMAAEGSVVEQAERQEVTKYLTLAAESGLEKSSLAVGAPAFDAWVLLRKALEQVMVLGLSPTSAGVYRQALRDSLIGLPPVSGAAGRYDFTESLSAGALAEGLVVVGVNGGLAAVLR